MVLGRGVGGVGGVGADGGVGGGAGGVEAVLDVAQAFGEFGFLGAAFLVVEEAEVAGVADDVGGEKEESVDDAGVFDGAEVEGGEFGGEGDGFLGEALGELDLGAEAFVAGEFAGEDGVDLVGDLAGVAVEGFAGEVLVAGDLAEDGLDAFGEASGDAVDLGALERGGFLVGLGQGVVGLEFLRDGGGEERGLFGLGGGGVFFVEEQAAGAVGDGVAQELVDGRDFAAGFGGGAFEVGGVGEADGLEGALLRGEDLGVNVLGVAAEQGAHDERGDDDGRELLLEFGHAGTARAFQIKL